MSYVLSVRMCEPANDDARGSFITAILGLVICPWKLLTGASVFLTVLSSFSVFLGPLTVRLSSTFAVRM